MLGEGQSWSSSGRPTWAWAPASVPKLHCQHQTVPCKSQSWVQQLTYRVVGVGRRRSGRLRSGTNLLGRCWWGDGTRFDRGRRWSQGQFTVVLQHSEIRESVWTRTVSDSAGAGSGTALRLPVAAALAALGAEAGSARAAACFKLARGVSSSASSDSASSLDPMSTC